jgi:hypothetical protein
MASWRVGGGIAKQRFQTPWVGMKFYGLPPIGQKQERPMDGAQFYSSWVGEAGGRLTRNRLVSSTKQGVVIEFYGLPPGWELENYPNWSNLVN